MQINPELLSEKNYTGTRLIEINDPKVAELKAEIKKYQEEANPILELTEPMLTVLEPLKEKRRALKAQCTVILEEMRPYREQYDEELKKLPEGSKESNPTLDALAEQIKIHIDRIKLIEVDIKMINDEMRPTSDAYETEIKKVELIDQKANLLKLKMVPLINSYVAGQLSEFEVAKHVVEKDGKIYAEIFDLLEEFIKTHRTSKTQK